MNKFKLLISFLFDLAQFFNQLYRNTDSAFYLHPLITYSQGRRCDALCDEVASL